MDPRSPFQPLDEFTARPYPVTVNFISAHAVYYPNFRNDPVFPAQFSGGYPGPDLYFNDSTRGGVLACVDQYQICESVDGRCWDNGNITLLRDEESHGSQSDSQYASWLLLIALNTQQLLALSNLQDPRLSTLRQNRTYAISTISREAMASGGRKNVQDFLGAYATQPLRLCQRYCGKLRRCLQYVAARAPGNVYDDSNSHSWVEEYKSDRSCRDSCWSGLRLVD